MSDSKNVVLVNDQDTLLVPSGMNLATFRKFVDKHELTPVQSQLVVDMRRVYKASVSYMLPLPFQLVFPSIFFKKFYRQNTQLCKRIRPRSLFFNTQGKR